MDKIPDAELNLFRSMIKHIHHYFIDLKNKMAVEVKKREYNVLPGQTHTVEAGKGGIIASQPSATSGVENYIIDLDAQQVGSMFQLIRMKYLLQRP